MIQRSERPKRMAHRQSSAAALLTSTLVFRFGGFPFGGFELEWSLVATSLENFSVTGHGKRAPGAPF